MRSRIAAKRFAAKLCQDCRLFFFAAFGAARAKRRESREFQGEPLPIRGHDKRNYLIDCPRDVIRFFPTLRSLTFLRCVVASENVSARRFRTRKFL